MKQIIKQGTPKIFTATCPECGCVFTFMKSDMEYVERPLEIRMVVTCPCCHEKVRSWKE